MLAANIDIAERAIARSDGQNRSSRPDLAGRLVAKIASILPDVWILLAVLGIWMLSAFDLVMTLLAGRHGWVDELNPLAAGMVTNTVTLSAFKLALVIPASFGLVAVRHQRAGRWALAAGLVLLGFVALRWVALFDIFAYIEATCPPGYSITW